MTAGPRSDDCDAARCVRTVAGCVRTVAKSLVVLLCQLGVCELSRGVCELSLWVCANRRALCAKRRGDVCEVSRDPPGKPRNPLSLLHFPAPVRRCL